MKIVLNGKIDEFWGYRKARMTYSQQQFEIRCDNEMTDCIKKFLDENGRKLDNHICWRIGNVYYNLSDDILLIGDRLFSGAY